MKSCNAKQDGKPCLNKVDEGQEYCPHHLGSQDADLKKKLTFGAIAVTVLASIYKVSKPYLGEALKVAKTVISKKI